jgi:hypothetical protein
VYRRLIEAAEPMELRTHWIACQFRERKVMERALEPLLESRGIPADDPDRWLELALFLAHEVGLLRGAKN